ncbi:MAG: glycosyltransferase family 2 protein [Anaerolineae bacterium]|nr:glycosyltransferase family 2 protein [Anaerolineae bacterium]
MDLAIIVVSYNTRELLHACLDSVQASLAGSPELEAGVWVVDNASADGSAAMVREMFPNVRLIALNENLGFSGGNNFALRALGFRPAGRELVRSGHLPLPDDPWLAPHQPPRHVLLLNSDAEVRGDALARLVAFLDETPRAGACGPQLVYPDGRFQHGAFRFPGLAQTALDLFPPPGRLNTALMDSRLNGRYPRRLNNAGQAFPVDFVLGASLTVRGWAIEQAGLLDESYFMYCEEMDWQQRLARTGWEVYCVPAAQVMHHGGASTSQFRAAMFTELWHSRLRYFARYHGPLTNRLLRKLIRAGMAAAAQRAQVGTLLEIDERLRAYDTVATLAGNR